MTTSRRDFLKTSSFATGGLLMGFALPGALQAPPQPVPEQLPMPVVGFSPRTGEIGVAAVGAASWICDVRGGSF